MSNESKNDPFLILSIQVAELWNERKAIEWITKKNKKRQLEKLEKMVAKIKAIDFDEEFKMLKELHGIDE